MCGFAGFYFFSSEYSGHSEELVLAAMSGMLSHRGPDDEAFYRDVSVGLAFRRLSIVDITGGGQPIYSEDGSLVLVANGEIYNHQELKNKLKGKHSFKSKSDCEVLVHLYEEKGIDFLSDINGMFAIALWDSKNKKLILARDRFGIKPLFFTYNQDRLLFGSEMKALFRFPDCPRQFNWLEAFKATSNFCHRSGYEIESFFEGIQQVKAGEYLVIEKGDTIGFQLQRKSYWNYEQLAHRAIKFSMSEQDIIDGYIELLKDSVRLTMMSDVEVGLFLSGGIDSVAIAFFASQLNRLKTFSCLNSSTFLNGDTGRSVDAASHLGIPNYQLKIEPNGIEPEAWLELLWACESPFCNMEQLYKFYMHKYIRERFPSVKTILLGQGSDEFNGGYSKMFLGLSPDYPKNEWPRFSDALNNFQISDLPRNESSFLYEYQRFLTPNFLYQSNHVKLVENPWNFFTNSNTKRLQMESLWMEDRVAMTNKIENRVPFLDHRIVEYLLKVPTEHYNKFFWDKEILRRGMSKFLPNQFVRAPKVPFFHGRGVGYTNRFMYELLTKNGNQLINEAFDHSSVSSFINRDAVLEALNEMPKDPSYSQIDTIARIVNMGLLDKMVRERFDRPTIDSASLPVVNVNSNGDWPSMQHEIQAGLHDFDKPSLGMNSVLKLSDDCHLLRDAKNKDSWALSKGIQLVHHFDKSKIDKSLLHVLMNIDGKRTLGELLLEKQILWETVCTKLYMLFRNSIVIEENSDLNPVRN